jgi:DNA-binding NarL/FixJ family response regulator
MGSAALSFPEYDQEPRRLTLVRGADHATGTIRVAVAHGRPLVRAGLRVLLERAAGIVVVGEAATGEAMVALARLARPDVVLMELDLPGLDSVGATRHMLAQRATGVMLLAASADDTRMRAALRAGAGGLLLEDTEPAELVRAVRVLAQGANVLPRLAEQLNSGETDCDGIVVPLPTPSQRQPRNEEYRMLTPKVTEIRRGCAHGKFMGSPNVAAASRVWVK